MMFTFENADRILSQRMKVLRIVERMVCLHGQ